MKETISTEDILKNIRDKERYIVFGFATMCKTCDISETMLSVVAEAKQISYERINLNFYTGLIEYYQIRSAPALLLFKNGELVKEVYAFQSVTYLNEVLEEFLID